MFWSGVELNLRPTVSRPVCLGVEPHLEPMTRFYMSFILTCTCFFMWGALSDERTSLYFAVHITHLSQLRRTHNHILLSHLRLGSHFVPSYDLQVYGEGILPHLHTGHMFCSSGVRLKISSRGPQRDYRLSPSLRVIVDSLPRGRVPVSDYFEARHNSFFIFWE
jgi:hypothetical protein